MTRRQEVAELCKKGLSPAEIAAQLGLKMYDVKTHLLTQVGEGKLRRSDILFSISKEQRVEYEGFITAQDGGYWDIFNAAVQRGYERETFRLFLDLHRERVWRGDLYEYISDVEIALHDRIKRLLVERYGDDGWWRQGIPAPIRSKCAADLESDPEPATDPFAYTTLIQLANIIDENWNLFSAGVAVTMAKDKKKFLADMRRLNGIRNRVMHPVKGIDPSGEDFQFVRELWRTLGCGRH